MPPPRDPCERSRPGRAVVHERSDSLASRTVRRVTNQFRRDWKYRHEDHPPIHQAGPGRRSHSVEYEKRTSRITNPDGSVVFEMNDAEIPEQWSQLATDIMVSKYFRKAGVPQTDANGQPLRDAQRQRRHRPGEIGEAGDPPPRRLLAVLGREARLLRHRRGRAGVLRRAGVHAAAPDVRPEQPAVVQHRPELGLRHHRPGAGPLLLRPEDRRDAEEQGRLLPPAAARAASSSPSATTSSTTAASWTCGPARRGSSSTAPAPARTSPSSAARTSRSPAAASRRA